MCGPSRAKKGLYVVAAAAGGAQTRTQNLKNTEWACLPHGAILVLKQEVECLYLGDDVVCFLQDVRRAGLLRSG